MTAIVMNTLTRAVSEYDFTFQSITPTHAGDENGFYLLGGDTDAGEPILSTLMTGMTLLDETRKKRLDSVFFSLLGPTAGKLIVESPSATYTYDFVARAAGESRAQPGKGIRESYLSFGFQNVNGEDFLLDRIDVTVVAATTRRI